MKKAALVIIVILVLAATYFYMDSFSHVESNSVIRPGSSSEPPNGVEVSSLEPAQFPEKKSLQELIE